MNEPKKEQSERVLLEAEVLPDTLTALERKAEYFQMPLGEIIDRMAEEFASSFYDPSPERTKKMALTELSGILDSDAYRSE